MVVVVVVVVVAIVVVGGGAAAVVAVVCVGVCVSTGINSSASFRSRQKQQD